MLGFLDRYLFGANGSTGNVREALDDIERTLKRIPSGHFLMGSDRGGDDEIPIHNVMLDEFMLMNIPVTQRLWRLVMNEQPWKGKRFVREGDDYPAVFVSYYDVARFVRRLNQHSGAQYRLPTEAEWEYAARAGHSWNEGSVSSTPDWGGSLRDMAWYYENAFLNRELYAHPVGRKRCNPWELYDMLGNVNEWCSDWYARNYYKRSPLSAPQGPRYGNKKMVRGGDWSKTDYFLRPTCRMYYTPHVKDVFIGFRLAGTIPEEGNHV